MKLALKIVVGLFAGFGVFCLVWVLVVIMAPRAWLLYKSDATWHFDMIALAAAAHQYAIDDADTGGKGLFPQGDTASIAKALSSGEPWEFLKHNSRRDEKGNFLDSWGRPFLFVSSGDTLCIISCGDSPRIGSQHNMVKVVSLPILTPLDKNTERK